MQLHNQSGVALLSFVLLLSLATTAVIITALDVGQWEWRRGEVSYRALNEAKLALLGYAVQNDTTPGTFPCPDTNNDGDTTESISTCKAYIGWLPWKKLALPPLIDGAGQCLWYAITPNFRETISVASRLSKPINLTSTGSLKIVGSNNVVLADGVIAVIFAPNRALLAQQRGNTANAGCPGDSDVSAAMNYLDSSGGVNNATGNVSLENYTFKVSSPNVTFNDQLLYIKPSELYPLLRKRIIKEIIGNKDVAQGLVKAYNKSSNQYPCPATATDYKAATSCSNGTLGLVPVDGLTLALKAWLINNGWLSQLRYTYLSATAVKVSVGDAPQSYTCTLNQNQSTCTSP